MKPRRRNRTGHFGNDFTGQRFGNLLVIERTEERTYNQIVFKCLCDCGTEIKATSSHINRKNSPITHCGCKGVGKSHRSVPGYLGYKGDLGITKKPGPRGDAALRSLYSRYKQVARNRKIPFSLNIAFFAEVTKKPCMYCGASPSQICEVGDMSYTYNGIDRLDNSQGYTIRNSNPCCGTCNRAKGEMTLAEFLEWLSRAYVHSFS